MVVEQKGCDRLQHLARSVYSTSQFSMLGKNKLPNSKLLLEPSALQGAFLVSAFTTLTRTLSTYSAEATPRLDGSALACRERVYLAVQHAGAA
jgi:hypothetical protein